MSSDPVQMRLIYPSSRGSFSLSETPSLEFAAEGLSICYKARSCKTEWTHLAGSEQERLDELLDALEDSNCEAILCGRGGYGASDLLPLIPWQKLQGLDEKPLLGFSDISALHSAFYTKLGWNSIHAPMPDTKYWPQNLDLDVKSLTQLLRSNQGPSLKIYKATAAKEVQGKVFGGCLSVLSNLIGTPYLPQDFGGHILFFEDIAEAAGKILRNLNQWIQSGLLTNCEAILLGAFSECNLEESDYRQLASLLTHKTGKPVYLSREFGHTSPNYPIVIGSQVSLDPNTMKYLKGTSHGT